MRYKFNDSNIITCYIKELLHSFNLPKVKVYTKELENKYDYKDAAGYITSTENSLYDGRVYIKDGLITKYENGTFNKISRYIYNYPIVNFTKKFIIKSSDYDKYTHKYLGDYLRFLRDYKKVDLMSMYNCFCYEEPKRMVLVNSKGEEGVLMSSGYRFEINTDDPNYNYFIVPVKFDQTYTIALNANIKYDIACLLYNDIFITNTPEELVRESYLHIEGSTFHQPFTYSTKFNCTRTYKLWEKEKDLCLLLKLPKIVDSSIVVLEGNYTSGSNIIDGGFNGDYIYNVSDSPTNYPSKLSLLALNDGESYPFADRLVEYLLRQAITSDDYIHNNIEYVQDLVYKSGISGYYGIWDDLLRYNIYRNMLKKDVTKGQDTKYSNTIIKYDPNEDIFDIKGGSFTDSEGSVYTLTFDCIFNAPNLYEEVPEAGSTKLKKVRINIEEGESYTLKNTDEGADKLTIVYTLKDSECQKTEFTEEFEAADDSTYVFTNFIGKVLINSEKDEKTIVEDKSAIVKLYSVNSSNISKREKRFIDIYNDLTAFVDKDVEAMLKLRRSLGLGDV